KFIDNGKLSIGLPGGEVKTFLFNIPENIKNLLKQKDYCETNSDTKQNFICNALNNDQKVIYR
ncbi:hypothetical protein K3W01_14995, partial [Listeria monocytogenes]|nr:hypothetical protein [Listeria monocytogenes]